jgi:alpha-glucosidase (family GH31 glycosyl hydrolase)
MGIQWLWTQGMLQDGSGIGYENTMATWEFRMGKDEQFVSLPEGVNVTGQSVSRHYKTAPDTVPAFVSSRNYGMLLNVDKRVGLNLGKNNGLKLSYHYGDQPMDLFVIVGKDREEIIQRYRKLTEH